MMNKSVAIWAAKTILTFLVSFGLFFAAWWLSRFGEQFATGDVDTARRVVGILIGIWFIITGNRLPKGSLVPPSNENWAVLQWFQRFLGWACVLTGVVSVLLWLALPVEQADALSAFSGAMLFFAAMFLLSRRVRHLKGEQRAI